MAFPSNEEKHSPLIIDLTGRRVLAVQHRQNTDVIRAEFPLDAMMDLDDPKVVKPNPQRVREAEYKERYLELKNFGMAVPLLCWTPNVLQGLWRAFFQVHQEALQQFSFNKGVVLIFPLAWGPAGMEAAVDGFSDVFGPNKVNACATTLPALFFGLKKSRYFEDGKGGGLVVQEQGPDGFCMFHYFSVTKTLNGLEVIFSGWTDKAAKTVKKQLRSVVWTPEKSQSSLALDGYAELLRHGCNPDLPHVSVDMPVAVGVKTGPDSMAEILEPTAPLGQWFQRGFQLTENQEIVEAYIYAWPKVGAFPLARLELTNAGPFEDGKIAVVQLVRDNHENGRAILLCKNPKIRSGEFAFRLPRLFF